MSELAKQMMGSDIESSIKQTYVGVGMRNYGNLTATLDPGKDYLVYVRAYNYTPRKATVKHNVLSDPDATGSPAYPQLSYNQSTYALSCGDYTSNVQAWSMTVLEI